MYQVRVPGVTTGQHSHYLSVVPPEEKKRDEASSVSPHVYPGAGLSYSFCLTVLFTDLCGSIVNYVVMEKADYTLSLVEEHHQCSFS